MEKYTKGKGIESRSKGDGAIVFGTPLALRRKVASGSLAVTSLIDWPEDSEAERFAMRQRQTQANIDCNAP